MNKLNFRTFQVECIANNLPSPWRWVLILNVTINQIWRNSKLHVSLVCSKSLPQVLATDTHAIFPSYTVF